MTAVAIYAFSQRANARTESRHAHARALLAEALHQLDVDPQLSMLLGLEAAKTERTEQTQDVLSQAVEASRMRNVTKVSDTAPIPKPKGGRVRVNGKVLPRGAIEAVAVSPNRREIATGHGDKTLRLWSAKTGDPLRVIHGHTGHVDAVAFSPDGKLIATGSSDGTGRLWTAAGDFVKPLLGHTGPVTAVAFNPRSKLVATASQDGTVRISQIDFDRLPLVLRGHRGAVTRVKFTRDGRIETVGTDRTRRSWDPEPEPWMHVVATPNRIPSLRPSRVAEAHGLRAAIAGNKVVVTNLGTGAVTTLTGQFGDISDVNFSPDGRWAVTAGPIAGGLWRLNSRTIHAYLRNTDRPLAAQFLSDTRIVTLARDGKVREWTCDYCGTLEELIRTAETRLAQTGRTFTADERRDFLNR
jgi:WD40 repeat protein